MVGHEPLTSPGKVFKDEGVCRIGARTTDMDCSGIFFNYDFPSGITNTPTKIGLFAIEPVPHVEAPSIREGRATDEKTGPYHETFATTRARA